VNWVVPRPGGAGDEARRLARADARGGRQLERVWIPSAAAVLEVELQRWFDDALDGLDLTASLDTTDGLRLARRERLRRTPLRRQLRRVRDGFTRELDRLRAMRDGDPPAPQTENEALLADLRARFGTTDPRARREGSLRARPLHQSQSKPGKPLHPRSAKSSNEEPVISGTADFSPCMRYRYELTRSWDAKRPELLVVMLNPAPRTRSKTTRRSGA
jgi:hypothetical protein